MGGSTAKGHDAAKKLGYKAGKIAVADNNLTAAEAEKLIRLLPAHERQASFFPRSICKDVHKDFYKDFYIGFHRDFFKDCFSKIFERFLRHALFAGGHI